MSRFFTKAVVLGVVIAALTPGCGRRDRNPVGSTLPDEDWFGEGPFIDTLLVVEEQSVRLTESAGASPFLLAGSGDGLTARFLVRFLVVPEADSIVSSSLELTLDDLVETDQLTLTVYPLTAADWVEGETTWELKSGTDDEDPVPWNMPGGDFDASDPLGSVTVTGSDVDSVVSIDLDVGIVRSWADTTVENAGLILLAEGESGTDGIAEFRSRQSLAEGSPEPHLFLEYTRPDDPDSVVEGRVLVGEDATLYDYEAEPPQGSLRVGSVPQFRTFLRFDLGSFGPETTVRRAWLRLPVRTIVPGDRPIVVDALRISGDWDGTSTPLEFTPLDSVEVSADGVPVLGITNLAWSWVGELTENQGIAVKASVERGRFGYVDFESSAGGPEEGPSLILEYTLPPSAPKEAPARRPGRD